MNRLRILNAMLVGGTSLVALSHPAAAKMFDIPDGDLATVLNSYIRQSGVQLVYMDDAVRGHESRGARGDLSEIAALTEILRGTGFTAHAMPSSAIGIMPEKKDEEELRVAQAARRAAAPLAPAQAGVETVVVTAQKKSENIQNVPIAVTALSQQQLTERQIAGGPDLLRDVPNMNFSKTNFTGYNIELRGIGTQAISVTTDPAVAVAFNGIPFIRNHFFEQEFYDLADVEVLRGPQGTLYGRNATAGVVNLKSALPDDQYEATLSADLGNYSNRRLEGMLNLPIVGDKLDLRIAGEWTKRDGYTTNEITGSPIDGRDLWSTRVTLGWKPASNVQTYLVWEHFQEDDDRMRTAKQTCKTAPIPEYVDGVPVPGVAPGTGNNLGTTVSPADYLSQGCLPASLYSPDAFEVPNGYALAYYSGLQTGFSDVIRSHFDVYSSTVQSQNLRVIESSINPIYKAKNDTLEFNADYNVTPALTFTSQTGYNQDFLWSTEDYNRFNSAPGAFAYTTALSDILPDPNGLGICQNDTGCLNGVADGQACVPGSNNPSCRADGVFCDPQLGCSDRLVAQDLSDERAWQLSQEFRLSSNFAGPLNFSVGGNYLHYETEENYYVFINTLTAFAISDRNAADYSGADCLLGGFRLPNPQVPGQVLHCKYVDTNPLSSLDNQGHNYFLSQNPYLLNSYAGFGEVYYKVTPELKLTGGLRWTEDKKSFTDIPSELLVPGYGYTVAGIVNQQWDQLTGRTAIDWTPKLDFTDQTLVYGSYAHGYKAGGANPPGAVFPTTSGVAGGSNSIIDPIHPLTFKPEFVDAFELGSKNTLLDGALTLDGDAFYYNYKNYQISRIVDRTAINDNFNAQVRGAELETSWEAAPGLKFSFAGGYENATVDKGQYSVDLIDRTAGNPNWMVVKPFITNASNCILPVYVVAELLKYGFDIGSACDDAYQSHDDPLSGQPFTSSPTTFTTPGGGTATYPGFNPLTAPNNGEGFAKNLGGNQLPNAPHFTTSLTAEYTMPVSDDWAATLHTDFYWQSQSWARVFNDRPYDKLRGYSNVNLSLILTSANGWQVMGYVKNVFDTTAITGDFLNSDDSGLTTNVFLTDPRLYGVRVTKHLDENDGFWGSDWSGFDLFEDFFADKDNGKPPLWIELGGQLDALANTQEKYSPAFADAITQTNLLNALNVQRPPTYALDMDGSLAFQPDDSDWIFSASIRYGRSSASRHHHQQTANAPVAVHSKIPFPPPIPTFYPGKYAVNTGYSFYPKGHVKFADGKSDLSEHHLILDFQAGKDVGLGLFGQDSSSTVSFGVRIAQFSSKSTVGLRAEPDVQYPTAPINTFYQLRGFKYNDPQRFHDYAGTFTADRDFHGVGPSLAWKNSIPFAGNTHDGELTFDWGVNGAVLFGRQRAKVHHQTTTLRYYGTRFAKTASSRQHFKSGYFFASGLGDKIPPTYTHHSANGVNRSREVTVPDIGFTIGASYKYQNAKISFGYRADEFFGAMDGGIDTYKSENRGFFGPYANISIGIGG